MTEILVKANRTGQQLRQKFLYDRTAKEPSFYEGQKVLLSKENVPVGLSKKLTKKYMGPYQIVAVGPNYTYKLKSMDTGKLLRSMINANRLRPYHSSNDLQNRQQDNINDILNDIQVNNDNADSRPANPGLKTPEKILRYKRQNGISYYRVKWLGLDASQNTWEYARTIPKEMREDFHIKYTSKNRKRKKPLTVFKEMP